MQDISQHNLTLTVNQLAPSQPTLAAILPTFNEAKRIGFVLDVLRQVDQLAEIIVVDDGSQDITAEIIQNAALVDPRIRLIRHAQNHGKGQAILTGWQATRAAYLLFLDSDLSGLTPQHVTDLIAPVLSGCAQMTLGLFRGGNFNTDFSHWFTPWLTGQRCLCAALMECIPQYAAQGYGFETALTIAARKYDWKIQKVILKGVSHPPSECHRGVFFGFSNRARMYAQILRAWYRFNRKEGESRSRKKIWFLSAILLLLSITSIFYNTSVATTSAHLKDIPPASLAGIQRLLVIAPHPDDETIGAGGLIQQALAEKIQVKVVILTNGDGQALAPLALNQKLLPKAADYIQIGIRRQSETVAAMRSLGVTPQEILFLGYPDGGLNSIWMLDWKNACPSRARFTRAEKSPYATTYEPNSDYCGSTLVQDLLAVLDSYRPDLIVLPHPNDEHPDHKAASNFARLAIAEESARVAAYQPRVWGYLVHFGYFPRPRGVHLTTPLLPPRSMLKKGSEWIRLDLRPDQVQQKYQAVQAYVTQEKLLGSFLSSFARPDELFVNIPNLVMAPLSISRMPLKEEGVIQSPDLPDPTEETTRRLLFGGTDLVQAQALRLGNMLWFQGQTRGNLLPGLQYFIRVKTPDGKTLLLNPVYRIGAPNRNTFFAKVNLADLGNPGVIGFSAEVKREVTLDRTSWHFIILSENFQ